MSAFRTIVMLLLIGSSALAQNPIMDTLTGKFKSFQAESPIEKIFVHVDRDFFVTGETMWFSVFLVNGATHQASQLSKVAYIEVIDQNNISVLSGKIGLEDGRGGGSFFIPATLASANYQLRAYTNWMKNQGSGFFFTKNVRIVNTFVKTESPKQAPQKLFAALFPEGGYLVEGLSSKVAIKITDDRGVPVQAKGFVLRGPDTLRHFTSNPAGLGAFSIKDGNYKDVQVHVINLGQVEKVTLPTPLTQGYTLSLKDTANQVSLLVQSNFNRYELAYLLIHNRHTLTHRKILELKNGRATFAIPRQELRDGVSHITLFNDQLQPVAERLVFAYPAKSLGINIKNDQQQYGVRRRVRSALATSPNVSLSVSIYKLDSLSNAPTEDIFSTLWLSSDLNGDLENASWYFSEEARSTGAMDLLMLTHGWRRFKWNDVLEGKRAEKFLPEFRGHLVTGLAKDTEGKLIKGVTAFFSSPGKIVRTSIGVSNEAGTIYFEAPDFFGARRVIAKTLSDTTITIDIQSPFYADAAAPKLAALYLSVSMEDPLLERSVAMQVQDVYFEKARNTFHTPAADSTSFFGKADETFYLDQYTRFPVMEEVMREYVPGVMVRKRRDGFHFIVLDDVNKTAMKDTPLILLDGVPLADADEIMAFDPRLVKKLEVLRRPYVLGPTVQPGIVSYSTYNGDLANFKLRQAEKLIEYEGLQLQREFYSPLYENNRDRNNRLPDRRNLLYWNGDVQADASGNVSLDFFTSDLDGTFLIRVEGIAPDGSAGSATQTFEVKRFEN